MSYETADDAGVYKLTPECALVQTVDFFTPIVDDPATFGAIAAANSLSDVYAMGARPLTALSVVAYPPAGDLDVLRAILRGGAEKMVEADCVILGGHSISDAEIKFGYAVTGTVHPGRVLANSGARPGDVLLLSKRLGTGVISTALKKGTARDGDVETAIQSMLALNRKTSEAMLGLHVHACTDITGFGLIGHAREMALASHVTLEIEAARLHYLPGALEYSRQEAVPGGLKSNREFASCDVELARELPAAIENLLYDPQTSGGLLVSLPEAEAEELERRAPELGRVGRVLLRGPKLIRIV